METNPKRLKVLLVEDNSDLCHIFQEYLRILEIGEVVAASNGMEAMEKYDKHAGNFDVVMSDLKMPKMDGMELLRGLADRHFQGGLILMTGEGRQQQNDFWNLAVFCGLKVLASLEKPFHGEALADAFSRYKGK